MVEHNDGNLDNIFCALFDLIISEIVRLNASHDGGTLKYCYQFIANF
jgi:hypothetical protein